MITYKIGNSAECERTRGMYQFKFGDESARAAATSAVIDFLSLPENDYTEGPGGVALKDDGNFGFVAEFCFDSFLKDNTGNPDKINGLIKVLKPFNPDLEENGEFGEVTRATVRAMRPPVVFFDETGD